MTAAARPFDLDLLRGRPELSGWVDTLERVTPADDLDLPAGHDLVDALLDLGVPHVDVADALAARPATGSDADTLVRRTASVLLAGLGDLEAHPVPPEYPHLHDDLRWLPLLAVVAAAPRTRRWWAGRGVGEDVVRATFADVGRHVTHTRRRHGHGGLCVNTDWLALHTRGRIVQLGRLQLERARLGTTTAQDVTAAGLQVAAGDHSLGVHIPDYCGPFTPQDCDTSIVRAVRFFATHLPEEDVRVATATRGCSTPRSATWCGRSPTSRRSGAGSTWSTAPPATTRPWSSSSSAAARTTSTRCRAVPRCNGWSATTCAPDGT